MITRREFNLRALGAAFLSPLTRALRLSRGLPVSAERDAENLSATAFEDRQSTTTGSSMDATAGDFTPFGYLDNPYHCWDLHRSGILRSLPGIGFGLYFPAGPGGYFDDHKNGVYHAFLRLGFWVGQRRLWAPADFREQELSAFHHSKNVLTYRVRAEEFEAHCSFFQAEEDALIARVGFGKMSATPVRLIAAHEYCLGNSEWWGGDGVGAAYDAPSDAWVTRSFAAGTVFAIAADAVSSKHVAVAATTNSEWAEEMLDARENAEQAVSYGTAPVRTAVTYAITAEIAASGITICMARGENRDAALAKVKAAHDGARATLNAKLADDGKFWARAPRIEGDWPSHWKNGWIYDFETLRMIVRRPVGIYKHPWDAMQIQAPRNVLAETSIDMFALSYADPETAKAVYLGQFLDAIAPNVPCARENGVANMVATDGSECGTSISWCYPFFCARSIYQRTGDRVWLAAVYPKLTDLLRWTIANRSDKEGFIVAKCSWESGMDASRRFQIDEPTGGEVTEFIRLVELQSATAQASAVLSEFAQALGDTVAEREWNRTRETYGSKTQKLWNGSDWFNDFDTRAMKPITTVPRDAGQVGPIFCDVASLEQKRAMIPTLRKFYEDSRDGRAGEEDPMMWSSLMLPYIESLWAAGESQLLADVIYLIGERIYTSMDRRTIAPGTGEHGSPVGWPGVSCEMWGHQGARGGEGYGWGAVMPAHIIRNILGVRETADDKVLLLSPNLPRQFMVPGRTYALKNLTLCGRAFAVRYTVTAGDAINVEGNWDAGEIHVQDAVDRARVASGTNAVSFRALNRHLYTLRSESAQNWQNQRK